MEAYHNLPISELSSGARRTLSLHLNPLHEIPSREGFPKDYRGVADLRGFRHLYTENFAASADPTAAMLRDWNSDGLHMRGTSVKTLLDILERLDRQDTLADLRPGLAVSLENYNHHKHWQATLSEQTTQVAQVSSATDPSDDYHSHVQRKELDYILSIHDTVDHKAYFDVFLSCSTRGENFKFGKMLVKELEKYNITCFLPARDALAAGSTYSVQGKLIKERCRKFVVLLSKDYVKSPECEFQVRFAQYLSPGAHAKRIIPIVIEPGARKPDILRPITGLDWTREDLREFFWERLVKTIRADVTMIADEEDKPEMDNLSLIVSMDDVWVDDPAKK